MGSWDNEPSWYLGPNQVTSCLWRPTLTLTHAQVAEWYTLGTLTEVVKRKSRPQTKLGGENHSGMKILCPLGRAGSSPALCIVSRFLDF